MKINFYSFALLCLIPRFNCAPQHVTTPKQHNELDLNLKRVDNDNGNEIKLNGHSFSENVAPLDESSLVFTKDSSETHSSSNPDVGGFKQEFVSENKNEEIHEGSLVKLIKEDDAKTNDATSLNNADEGLNGPPLFSGTDASQTATQEGHSAKDINGPRFKKQVENVKYSEPRPFKYKFHDPLTGSYRFGYGTQDQYRTEMRTVDGVVTGSYGWRDDNGKWHQTNFIADKFGYRITPPNEQTGPPLDIPPPSPGPPAFNPFQTDDRYQHDSSHQNQDKKNSDQDEKRLEDKESEDESLNKFHSINSSGVNKQGVWSDSLKSSRGDGESDNKFFGENKFKYPVNPSSEKAVISQTLSLEEDPKIKNREGSITKTNLQDNFFNSLPLNHLQSTLESNFTKPFEIYPPKDYTLPKRKTWPATIERVFKPFRQKRISTEGRDIRAKSMNKGGQKIYMPMDVNLKANFAKSTLDNEFQNSQRHFIKVPNNFHYLSRVPTNMLFQNKNPKTNFQSYLGSYIPTGNSDLNLLSLINSSGYLRPFYNFIIFPVIQKSYLPNIVVPPLAFMTNFYPLTDNIYYNSFSNYPGSQHHPFFRPYNPQINVLFNVNIYTTASMLPANDGHGNEPFTPSQENNSTKDYDSKEPDDNMDYLLLSNEFKEVNGSITNDPAFGTIQEHQLNKTGSNSSALLSQNEHNFSNQGATSAFNNHQPEQFSSSRASSSNDGNNINQGPPIWFLTSPKKSLPQTPLFISI